ncbi:uncharacterized protein [Watersipora subatra]|uniref:uncharacterized protein n=1 Tax=Watersipora subatra TaxID=2589382 RepID=UPI00355AD9F1
MPHCQSILKAECLSNHHLPLYLRSYSNIRLTYSNLGDNLPCFELKEVLPQCIQNLEQIRVRHGIQHLLVISAPGPIVCVYGESIERFGDEIENVFLEFGFEVRVQNRRSSGGITNMCFQARVQKIVTEFKNQFSKSRHVAQTDAKCELIATAKEKQSDGSHLEVMYAIVPAHLLHSGDHENNQPPVSINFLEPASQPFIFTFHEDDTRACNLQATPIFKYQITKKIQSDEQSHSHMNDIAALKFEQKPKRLLNAAVKPLPVPKQSYINFLAERQSVVMVGGHVGRIVPSPIVVANDCWAFGLHLSFVIPSTESSQIQRFEEGDSGKVIHIQYKDGRWIPIAMLVGKYTVEIPEYGSSIYIAIILSEALNEIERDFGDIFSDIQLHPTSSLYSGEGTELTSEEKLSISSAAELRYNKERFASFTNLKELKIEDTRLDSSDFKALEKLTSLERLRLQRCKFPRISFDSLTKLKELEISRNKLNSSSLVGMEKLKSLEKLDLHSCSLPELPYRCNSMRQNDHIMVIRCSRTGLATEAILPTPEDENIWAQSQCCRASSSHRETVSSKNSIVRFKPALILDRGLALSPNQCPGLYDFKRVHVFGQSFKVFSFLPALVQKPHPLSWRV